MILHTTRGATVSLSVILYLLCSCLLPATVAAQNQGKWYAEQTKGVDPEKRHESAFVRSGDLFYLIGGRGQRTIQVYDPATNTWSNTSTKTDNIHHFQAQAYDGKIYLLGALTQGFPNEDPLTNVLIYDPQQDKLITGATIPPARRRGSSGIVVYNGVFYIVAGNRNGHSAFMDDGTTPANVAWTDKFNPATGEWTVLPDAPHARDHFFAEIIGDKLYVAGGRRSRVGTPDGAWKDTEKAVDVFDLTNERWLTGDELPAALPTARAGAATAVINNELLVIGGEIENNPPSNLALAHTEALNVTTGKWRRLDDLILQRHATQAIVYQDDVYVAGGSKTKGGTEIAPNETYTEVFSFDGAVGANYDNWTTIGTGAVPRSEATAVTYRGEYYMFNGFDSKIDIYDRVEKYNPATNTYTSLKPMPTVNGKLTAVTHNGIALVDDVIWIVGGRVDDHPGKVTDAVWLYDIPTDSWSGGPTLPARRGGGGLGLLGRKLHYVGGFDENAQCDVDDHLVYDLDNPGAGWQDRSATSPMPMARNHFAAVVLDGKLYTIGGQNGHDGCGGGADNKLVHVYDPATDSWSRLADLPAKQSHAEPSTFAHNGKILSVGGAESGGKGVWEYDPATNKWTVLGNMQLPEALLAPVARVYGENMVVLNGGSPNVGNPRSQTRVKRFVPADNPVLSFNPSQLSVSLEDDESKAVSVILSNLNGELGAPYSISTSTLPAWLSVSQTAGYVVQSSAEIDLQLSTTDLSAGDYTYTLEATSAGYQSAKLTITLTVKGTPPPGGGDSKVDVYLEAECAAVGEKWSTVTTSNASNNTALAVQPGNNTYNTPPSPVAANLVTFTTQLSQADDYQLYARIKAANGGDDSFWVRVNGGSWIKWWQGLQTGNTFDWRKVDNSPFSLPAGQITIDFAFREDGAQLDKLLLTNKGTLPQGKDNTASNCGTTPPPPPPPTPVTTIRINAGGPTVSYAGEEFVADTDFNGGKTYVNSSATVPTLYQSERSSNSPFKYSYRVAVPNGEYKVRLHFAEIYFGANGGGPAGSGKRVFDVSLENKLVLDNYDINQDVGPQTITVKEFPVSVTDGYVDLFLDASAAAGGTDQPKLSALEIIGGSATEPPPAPITELWAEAECSSEGGSWQKQPSSGASNGQYVKFPGNANRPAPTQTVPSEHLNYIVSLTEAGDYTLYFRMNTPSPGENSFWVSIDGGKWNKFWRDTDGSQLLTNGFEWREVNDDIQPLNLLLAAGNHTIRVAPREEGTQLDKIYLGTAKAPSGQGATATNCSSNQNIRTAFASSPGNSSQTDALGQAPKISLYPNPVGNLLNFELSGMTAATAEVQIIDMNGRLLSRTVHQTADNAQLRSSLDVTTLPAGTYHLRIISSNHSSVLNRSFVKSR